MSSDIHAGDAEWVAGHRRWASGRRRLAFSAMFVIYLVFVAVSDVKRPAASEAAGLAILVAFVGVYAALIAGGPEQDGRRYWSLYGLMVALVAAEAPFAHTSAFLMLVYVTSATVLRLDVRAAAPIVALYTLAALFVPSLATGWHTTVGDTLSTAIPVAIPIVGVATFGLRHLVQSNDALADARAELARVSAENERIRIARDLHDLLGHSLTAITVKAGLAHRLGETDPARAIAEIAEVEALARGSLTDVRAAVTGYREVTLAGELATGREVLRAAGIDAELPRAVDGVDPRRQELLGWVVREALTNCVRHSRATACEVRLSHGGIEILDDGVGAAGVNGGGSGLRGLRERVDAAGGTLHYGPRAPRGWRLAVTLRPEADAA